jgi:hypothetical protein
METAGNGGNGKNVQKFICELCDFKSSQKSDYDRHVATLKHQTAVKWKRAETEGAVSCLESVYPCSYCNRSFTSHSGLWKHTRKCKDTGSTQQNVVVDLLMKQNELIMKQNNELHDQNKGLQDINKEQIQLMIKKDDDFRALVIELCKNTQAGVVTTNNSNSNSNNNFNNNTLIQNNNCNNTTNNNTSFNLNFFLNETCKDALNMSDFIKSIQVGFEDIERIGNIGYVDGISGIIIKSLQELGVERRPIHCTDAKRQTLYIKENNEWNKEDPDWSHLQHMVNEVQKINLRKLPAWRDHHPNCLTSTSKYTTTYNTMSQELMGGDCKKVKMQVKDNKIMNKIMREVVIDKSLYFGLK